jgi:hypothetical protein
MHHAQNPASFDGCTRFDSSPTHGLARKAQSSLIGYKNIVKIQRVVKKEKAVSRETASVRIAGN